MYCQNSWHVITETTAMWRGRLFWGSFLFCFKPGVDANYFITHLLFRPLFLRASQAFTDNICGSLGLLVGLFALLNLSCSSAGLSFKLKNLSLLHSFVLLWKLQQLTAQETLWALQLIAVLLNVCSSSIFC